VGAAGSGDYATIAYAASTGSLLWVARYDGPAGGDDVATAVAVSPDGAQVFVTGASESEVPCPYDPHCREWATVAYDTMIGSSLWTQRHTGPVKGRDFACCLGV